MEIDPQKVSRRIALLMLSGVYEREEATQIPWIVEPGDRIVELGGGIGYISSVVGKLNMAEEIVVYEANPDLIPVIARTHGLNNIKAEVVNAVVLPAKQRDTAPFYIRDEFWESSLQGEHSPYSRVEQVPVISFAEMVRRHRPTMLIVDIEGGEGDLFQDIELAGIKKIYIEVHQLILGPVGMKRLFDFFSSRGFHYDQFHSTYAVILFTHVSR